MYLSKRVLFCTYLRTLLVPCSYPAARALLGRSRRPAAISNHTHLFDDVYRIKSDAWVSEESVNNSGESTAMENKRFQSNSEGADGGVKVPRNWLGRKKDSEFVFRPLKLKFRVKELEDLYNSYVYRQRQKLLLIACFLVFLLSLFILVYYFASRKVSISKRINVQTPVSLTCS